ncbi:hypothetical protein [Singulisphaera sp. PoT]|uniref:hypothetical protein n=1 Tax=Singulisphaera sp. PoT TaxID=3411797 RepID=UPI003BF4C3DA
MHVMAAKVEPAVSVEALLDVLANLPVTCPRTTLAGCLPLSWDALDDLLAGAEAEGLIDVWDEAPGQLAIVLTPLAAERLGVEIVEAEDGERWLPIGAPPPPRLKVWPGREISETGMQDDPELPSFFETEADPEAHEPYLELIAYESAERIASELEPPKPEPAYGGPWRYFDSSLGSVPWPRIILGLAMQWPVVRAEGEPCPCCRGRKLELVAFCLVCERSGVDRFLPKVLANQLPKSMASEATKEVEGRIPVACKDDPGYVERDGMKVPERFARMMKG